MRFAETFGRAANPPDADEAGQAVATRASYHAHGSLQALFTARDAEVLVEGPAGTGKSRAILEYIHGLLIEYPGARGIITRKTLTSLTGSGLETYRTDILAGTDAVHFFGGSRDRPPAYVYRNGSELRLGSFHTSDAVEKVKSTDYDFAYPQEATELTEDDWEILTTRCRRGSIPFQQVIGDANPVAPTHWLNQRCVAGQTRRITSRHQDNPRYWDEDRGTWTPEGERYVQGTLANLTGLRRKRLYQGLWVSAEGVVYESWDPAVHVVDEEQLEGWGITSGPRRPDGFFDLGPAVRRTWASQDWGYTNPGVLQIWAEDGDGRLYRLHEVYRVHQLVETWWLAEAERLAKHYRPQRILCDPSEPAYIATYRRKGLPAEGAPNEVKSGIQEVQQRLEAAGDGRPRLVVLRLSQDEADPELVESKRPWSFEQEVEAYAWDTAHGQARGEEPVKVDDHAADATRYLCRYLMSSNKGRPRVPARPTRQFAGTGRRQFGV